MFTQVIGWLLGIDGATSIDGIHVSLAAPWAEKSSFWVFLGCVAALCLAIWFYWKFQDKLSPKYRVIFGTARGILLAMLILTLADPILQITATNDPQPIVYAVFDGTQSMSIVDQPLGQSTLIPVTPQSSADPSGETPESPKAASRVDLLKQLLSKSENNLLDQLQTEKNIRIEPLVFDGVNTSTLRRLTAYRSGSLDVFDAKELASQLSTQGKVTATGDMLTELSKQFRSSRMAGVLLFSDFAHNSGIAPLGSTSGSDLSPIRRVGAPIHTIGIGAVSAIDLAVEVQPPPKMKKAERANITVRLTQTGLDAQAVTVRVTAQNVEKQGINLPGSTERILVGTETILLSSTVHYIDLSFTPKEAGRFAFVAEVDPQPGEITLDNNRSSRSINIIDDYLRLMYVENEPTWEWRFIKEVFHRDKLVGMRGFRTFLRSADPKVRQNNDLFLSTLTPKRSDFFANDVIFLGDMPGATVSDRFCEMTREFVGNFGGGLVVIAGPHYGPGQLADSPLADMLPVKVNSGSIIQDNREFDLQLTRLGMQTDFMQLGQADDAQENMKAWKNLGKLSWYQPVSGIHSQAVVLAEHPYDTCDDGKTPQPLIAVRRYGNGEVVYVAFNELWRLRRKHGELYYRQFWSQLINRLGLGHALGSQKRFVVRSDREKYQADDKAIISVEAYDENFEPLTEEELNGSSLTAEMLIPDATGSPTVLHEFTIPQLRDGRFETRVPVYNDGQYQVRVLDPVTKDQSEIRFQVEGVSAELRNAVRNVELQDEIARQSGGSSFEISQADQLLEQLHFKDVREEFTRNHPLWATPLWFILITSLMLGEWFSRKVAHLA
ncbi:MAG: hypothetical protein ACKVH8_01870 [Pirellulales bacterium]